MEVSVDEVSCLVQDWLSSSLRAAPSRPLPLYQPISPRPERLGLGAEVSGNTVPPKALTGSKVWQSVSGRRKSHHPSSMSVPEDCPIQGISSDDDASCSRSAAIDGAKRKHPAASFTTEMMAQSRKRRRRRKKDKTLELNTDGIDVDMWKGESVHTTTKLTRPTSDGTTSTCATELDKPLQANSASVHDVEGGGTFQLFVHIEGASEGEKEPTYPSDEQWSQHEKMKTNTKQALRGGSAHYCNKRRGRRLLKGSLSKSKHHPSSSAELSNCHTSITSMGAAQSNSVSKQGALFEQSQDRLKGKELRQSHTPPGPAVDAGHHSSEVTQREASRTPREGSRTLREGSNVIMEKGGHRRIVTRGSRGDRRRVMRCRKGTRIAQSSSHSLLSRLYLRKV